MKRVVASELMDDPDVDAVDLAANFVDIERANRHFGGIAPIRRAILGDATIASLLDVGCGSGDVPRAIAEAARRRGRKLRVVGLDRSDTVVAIARRGALEVVRGDATDLPFADGAFDATTCNLALHHFEPGDAVVVLRELRRVARVTPIVCDLERSWLGYVAALVFVRLFSRNALTRHDGPLSVRRAYTARESAALARRAGWRDPHVRRSAYFRYVLTDRG